MQKRLYRSRTDRLIWGVCGGLAKYFDVDPVLVRVAFIVFAFASGLGIVAYIIMAIVVPLEGSSATNPRDMARENIEEIKKTAEDFGEDVRSGLKRDQSPDEEGESAHRRRNLIGIIIIGIGVLVLLATLNVFWWFRWGYLWPILLIILGLIIILTARRAR